MEKLLLTNSNDSIFEVELIRYFSYDQEYYLIYTLNEKDDKNYLKLYLVEILEELGELIAQNIKDDDEWKNMQNIVKKVIKEIKADTRDLLNDESPLMLEKIKVDEPRYFKLDEKLANILSSNYSYSDNNGLTNEEMNAIDDKIIDNDFIIEPIYLPNDEIIILETEEGENMNIENMDYEIDNNTVVDTNSTIVPENNIIEQDELIQSNSVENAPETGEVEEIKTTEINEDLEIDDQDIDYKKLYYAIKKEKDATDVLLDDLLQKLLKYKEKYGELED